MERIRAWSKNLAGEWQYKGAAGWAGCKGLGLRENREESVDRENQEGVGGSFDGKT